MKKVKFKSEGLTLTGVLRSPENVSNKKLPIAIVLPSWINIKEQFAAIYGERLAREGFHTLTFDFRNYGESEGEPRNYEDPKLKVQDIKSAISFVSTLSEVDATKIYIVGICAGAAYGAVTVSEDNRVKKLAMVASWLHDGEAVKLIYGGAEGVADKIAKAQAAREKFKKTGVVDFVPKASRTNSTAAMYGDFDYYLNDKRGGLTQWEADKFAVMSWEPWLTFNPLPVAKKLSCPLLMVHADDAALPQYAKNFFHDAASLPKQLYWTQGAQTDFYDQEKQVNESVHQVANFLNT
jgi:fermentation-respiration switch protein FrsA (DUF1100 family)